MIAERPGFRGRSRRQHMRIQGGKQGALIDEIVAGVADQSYAVQQQASDELCANDEGIQSQSQVQARSEMGIGGAACHACSVARAACSGKRSRREAIRASTAIIERGDERGWTRRKAIGFLAEEQVLSVIPISLDHRNALARMRTRSLTASFISTRQFPRDMSWLATFLQTEGDLLRRTSFLTALLAVLTKLAFAIV